MWQNNFFLTRYHDVHNSYGRASIRLDGKELTNFSWVDMYKQEFDVNEMWKTTGEWDYDNSEFKKNGIMKRPFSIMIFCQRQLSICNCPLRMH